METLVNIALPADWLAFRTAQNNREISTFDNLLKNKIELGAGGIICSPGIKLRVEFHDLPGFPAQDLYHILGVVQQIADDGDSDYKQEGFKVAAGPVYFCVHIFSI